MKKIVIKSVMAVLMVLFSYSVYAYNAEVNGIYYNLNKKEKTATVTYKTNSYNSYTGSVTVPASIVYEDVAYDVTSIGILAFKDCSSLISVNIPNSVTSIGESAFYNCSGLTSIEIPNSVTSIGDQAFYGCTNLTKVIVADISSWCKINFSWGTNPLEYAHHLYSDENTEIENLVIPNDVTSIGAYAFYKCEGLTSVCIPSSVTSISQYAFSDCIGLTSVTIPSKVTSIGEGAFSWYNGEKYTIRMKTSKPPTIGTYTFSSSMATIEVPQKLYTTYKSATNWSKLTIVEKPDACVDGIYYNLDQSKKTAEITYKDENYNSYSESVNVPASIVVEGETYSVTSVGFSAFRNCTGLLSLKLPASITLIDAYAFYGCSELVYLPIPQNLMSVAEYSFSNCTSLTTIALPNGVTTIGNNAFEGCNGIATLTIPQSVTSIGSNAFKDCIGTLNVNCSVAGVNSSSDDPFYGNKFTTINIGGTVNSIGKYVFYDISSATTLNITNGLQSLGGYNFYTCPNLPTVLLPNSLQQFGLYLLYNFKGKLVVECAMPSYTLNTESPFLGCKLTSFEAKTGVQSIGSCTFYNCRSLKEVTLANTVSNIESSAFNGCESITSVVMPGVENIGSFAFRGCSALKSVELPSVLTDIGERAFESCGLTSLTVPDCVTSIGTYAFGFLSALSTITIPNSVTSLGAYVLYGSRGTLIVNCNIPQNAFANTYLTSVIIGEDVSIVGNYAFQKSTSLTSVNVKSIKLTQMGDYAFKDCSQLTTVNIPDIVSWCEILFGYQGNPLCCGGNLYVDDKLITDLVLPKGIEKINNYAFYNCKSLKTVKVPQSVQFIQLSAFDGCTNLESVDMENIEAWCKISFATAQSNPLYNAKKLTCNDITISNLVIPESITTIQPFAFCGCETLTSLTIHSKVSGIGQSAFNGCTNLANIYNKCTSPQTITNNQFSTYGNLHVVTGSKEAFESATNWKSFTITDDIAPVLISNITLDKDLYLGEEGDIASPIATVYPTNASYQTLTWTSSDLSVCNVNATTGRIVCMGLGEATITVASTDGSGVSKNAKVRVGPYTQATSISLNKTDASLRKGESLTLVATILPTDVTSKAVAWTTSDSKIATVDNGKVTAIGVGSAVITASTLDGSNLSQACVVKVEDPVQNITFVDDKVKTICVANWDTNGDGELSEAEAAAVTDLGTVFKNNTQITSFDELQYFTGLTSIGAGAFYNCNGLISVIIPNSVTSIDNYAFCDCIGLTSVTISNNVTSIGEHAFEGCSGLTSVSIPNSVTSIGYGAFKGCNGLTSVSIPNNVTSIETDAFSGCSGLTSVRIPNSVTSIGNSAFYGCSSLTSVTIPNSVTSIIGSYAFKNCTNLTSVVSEIEEPSDFNIYAFQNISSTCTLTVPYGTKDAYIAKGWSESVFKGGIVEAVDKRQEQTMELTSLPTMTYGDETYTLPVKTQEGLALTWTSGDASVATINNNTLTVKGAGTATITASQAGDDDYKPFSKEFSLAVNKAPLTITAKSYTIKQGEALPTYDVEYSGFKNNETEEALTKKPTITCIATSGSAVGTYDITVSGAEAKNYNITFTKGMLTIAEADPVTVTAKSYTREYGEANPTFEYTSDGKTLEGTPDISCEATKSSPVGTYAIVVKKGTVTNYNDSYVNGTLTITKAPLTITAKDCVVKQGEALPTFEVSYNGFKNDEAEGVLTKAPVITCSATSANELGTFDITVSGAEAENYDINYVAGTITVIDADAVVVTAKSYTREYGEANPSFEYTSEGKDLEGTPDISCEATKSSPVGAYAIVVKKGTVTNYNDSYVNGTLTITKAPLTITAKNYTIKQGEALPAFDVEYSGFKNNESEEALTKKPTIACTATSNSVVGTYDITVSGAEAKNYDITFTKGTLTIAEADPVTVTAKSYTREYGEANPTFEYTSDGKTLEGTPDISCEATKSSPVGTYSIVIKKGTVTNYNDSYVDGTLTITKAPLTITAKDCVVKQGEALPTFEVLYNGFKNDETEGGLTKAPVITCSATSANELGTFEITVSGAEAENYDISYVAGTLTVIDADAVVVTAKNYTREYGEANPTFEYTSEGKALEGTPEISCEATKSSPVGTYSIVVKKGTVTNYNDSYVNGTLTITKAPLTITAKNYTIKQGEALPTFDVEYSGFKNNETEAVLTKKPTIACIATSKSAVGTYDITVSGAEADNYEISYVKGTLTITENEQALNNTLSVNAAEVYNGISKVVAVNMNNAENITALQFEVTLPEGVNLSKCQLTDRKGDDHTVSFKQLANGNYQVTVLSMSKSVFGGTAGALVNLTLSVDEAMQTGDYTLQITNIELTTSKAQAINPADVSAALKVSKAKVGDVNGDGKVSITDAVAIVSYILGEPVEGFIKAMADVNGDGNINVFDVRKVVNIILGVDVSEAKRRSAKAGDIATEILYIEDLELVQGETKTVDILLDNPDVAYSDLQFDLYLPEGITVMKNEAGKYMISKGSRCTEEHVAGISYKDGHYVGMLYSMDVSPLSGNSGDVLTLTLKAADDAAIGSKTANFRNVFLSKTDATGPTYDEFSFGITVKAPEQPVTVTAEDTTMVYGDEVPELTYKSEGEELNGTPELSTTATKTSPVGTYPITVAQGTVTNTKTTYVDGTLTITKAPLTITAKSYGIKQGETLPTFEVEYSGFKNNETEEVLKRKPTIICDATSDRSGTYKIVVSDAEAENYELTYVEGILIIEGAEQPSDDDTFEEDGADYEKQNDNTVTFNDKKDASGNYEIPETVTHDGVEYQVTAIADGAFKDNKDLTEVSIPGSITSIGDEALAGCTNLEAVHLYADDPINLPQAGGSSVFNGVDLENCILYVPAGSGEAYRQADGWKEFKNIVEMGTPRLAGDANGDGTVNVFDVTAMVNYILGSPNDGFVFAAADVNGDGIVNVFDVTKVVNIILGVDDSEAKTRKAEGQSGTDKLYIENFEIEPGEEKEVTILLDNPDAEYRDLQYDLYLPEGISVVQDEDEEFLVETGSRCTKKHTIGFSYTDGHYVCMLYSTAKNPLTGNSGDILTITLKADGNVAPGVKTGSFRNVSLSKTDATGPTYDEFSFELKVKGEVDAIEDVDADSVPSIKKIFRNGEIIIIRDGKEYDTNGKPAQ